MSESSKPPIKTCDYCGKNGYMPTFRDGETLCLACLKVLPETAADGRRKVHEQEQVIKSLTEEVKRLRDEGKRLAAAGDNEPLVMRFLKGDFVYVTAGPHTGRNGSIRLTDGVDALISGEGRNSGTVVALKHCRKRGA
jgi:hypothetical protein